LYQFDVWRQLRQSLSRGGLGITRDGEDLERGFPGDETLDKRATLLPCRTSDKYGRHDVDI
jgi:hypothetical protein